MSHDCEQCPDPSACRDDDNGECCQDGLTDAEKLAKIKVAFAELRCAVRDRDEALSHDPVGRGMAHQAAYETSENRWAQLYGTLQEVFA